MRIMLASNRCPRLLILEVINTSPVRMRHVTSAPGAAPVRGPGAWEADSPFVLNQKTCCVKSTPIDYVNGVLRC